MAEIKFQFDIDTAAAVRKGMREHGTVVRRFDLSALSQDDRDLLAKYTDRVGGSGPDSDALKVLQPGARYTLTVGDPTAEGVVAALRAAVDGYKAEQASKKAEEDAEVARLDAEDAAFLAAGETEDRGGRSVGDLYVTGVRVLKHSYAPQWVKERLTVRNSPGYIAFNDRLLAERVAEATAERAERKAKEAEAKRKMEAEFQREQEMNAWIEAHGSDRLKACVANGWECGAAYRDERLAAELPGWERDGSHLPNWDEPRNPPANAIDLFERAKASVPAEYRDFVCLVYWTKEDDDGDTRCGYAATVELPWDDGGEAVYGYDGPVDDQDD